jgi:hypothetical protein
LRFVRQLFDGPDKRSIGIHLPLFTAESVESLNTSTIVEPDKLNGGLVMRIVWMLPLIAAMAANASYGVTHAAPVNPQPLAAPASNIQLAYEAVRGPRGGAAVRGPRGGVAVRGPYGGAAVRGPYGGAAVRGPYGGRAVVGRTYYGGVWYGTGRRYWNGRWWPYGVGTCWRASPIGYVWVCG